MGLRPLIRLNARIDRRPGKIIKSPQFHALLDAEPPAQRIVGGFIFPKPKTVDIQNI
jgi:hypothetical protein